MLIPLKDFNQQVRIVPSLLLISLQEASTEYFALCHVFLVGGTCDIPSPSSSSLPIVLNDVCTTITTAILYCTALHCIALYYTVLHCTVLCPTFIILPRLLLLLLPSPSLISLYITSHHITSVLFSVAPQALCCLCYESIPQGPRPGPRKHDEGIAQDLICSPTHCD